MSCLSCVGAGAVGFAARVRRRVNGAQRAAQARRAGSGAATHHPVKDIRMTVRLGINPITWTNDDVPELGGDTPLEVCLSETQQAGYQGTELGGKFPRQSAVLGPILDSYGLDLVSGWYDGRICEREVGGRIRRDPAAPHAAARPRRRARRLRRYLARPSRRDLRSDLATTGARRRRMAGLWRQDHPTRRAHGRVRSRHGLPPPHGHDRRDRCGDRRADDRRRARPSACSTTPAIALSPAATRRPCLQRHVDRVVHVHCKDVRPDMLEPSPSAGHELHGRRHGRHLHRPGRRLDRLCRPCSRSWPTMAMPAGSWSRRSRTRPRRTR